MSSLAVLAKPELSKEELAIKAMQIKRARRLAMPARPSKKFKLSNKEIQIVHVATAHLNMWLLDTIKEYPDVEEMYNSIKALSCKYMDIYDREIAYAQKNLNKLSDNLPNKFIDLTIKAGSTSVIYTDTYVRDIKITGTETLDINRVITNEHEKEVSYTFTLSEPLDSDYTFRAEIYYVVTTINPLIFGLSLIQVIVYFPNIDYKLRERWRLMSNKIYSRVETELNGAKDYSFKNSNLLTKMYTSNINTENYPL